MGNFNFMKFLLHVLLFVKLQFLILKVFKIKYVFKKKDERKLTHFCSTANSSRIKTRSQFSSISKDSKGNFLIKVSLRYEESIQYLVIGEGQRRRTEIESERKCLSVSLVGLRCQNRLPMTQHELRNRTGPQELEGKGEFCKFFM